MVTGLSLLGWAKGSRDLACTDIPLYLNPKIQLFPRLSSTLQNPPLLSLKKKKKKKKRTKKKEMGAGKREIQTSLDGLREKNLMQLKKLNTALFPVRYNDKYYADALAAGDFSKLGEPRFWV